MSWPAGSGGGGGGGPETDPIAGPAAATAQDAADAAQSTADSAVDAATSANSAAGIALSAANAAQDAVDEHIADATAAHASTAISGLGTAAALNVGTGANNVVQLNGSSQLPAVSGSLLTNLPAPANAVIIAADTWDLDTPLGTDPGRQGYAAAGWTLVGDGATDEAGYTLLTPSVVLSYLTRAVPAQITETGSWEMRVKLGFPASAGGSSYLWLDAVGWTRGLYLKTTGEAADGITLQYLYDAVSYLDMGNTSLVEVVTPVVLTFRRTSTSGGNGTLTAYVNDRPTLVYPWRRLAATLGLADGLWIGHITAGTGMRVYRVAVRSGINPQPVALGLATGGWL